MLSDDDRRYAEERLGREVVIWLTTVRADGQPQSSPVWFWWDGRDVWIWSLPGSGKVPNLRGQPRVSLHLEGDGTGGEIVTMEGTATFVDRPVLDVPQYVAKYHDLIEAMGSDDERFAAGYSVGIRVTPTRTRVYRD